MGNGHVRITPGNSGISDLTGVVHGPATGSRKRRTRSSFSVGDCDHDAPKRVRVAEGIGVPPDEDQQASDMEEVPVEDGHLVQAVGNGGGARR